MDDTIPVLDIIQDSIVDGEGLRSVLFVAGCPHRCNGCHNPQSWDKCNGTKMSLNEIFEKLIENELNNVTFSGGEPFLYAKQLTKLAKMLKAEGKTIWCWTGFTIEKIKKISVMNEFLKQIDVLVDGNFILEQRDISLYWKGSKNQRVMMLDKGEVIQIFDDETNEWKGSGQGGS